MDIKLRKAQLSKIIQSGEYAFLGKCAGPLIKVYTDLTKKAFVPLATIEYAPTIDGTIQKKKKNAWRSCCKSRKKNYVMNFEWRYERYY